VPRSVLTGFDVEVAYDESGALASRLSTDVIRST